MGNFKKFMVIGISILSTSILLSGIFIGYSIKSSRQLNKEDLYKVSQSYVEVLSITQVSKYLNMSEDEVKGIINIEKTIIDQTGSFSGKMFPYIIVNNKYCFYKETINDWLKERSNNRGQYDTGKGFMLQ